MDLTYDVSDSRPLDETDEGVPAGTGPETAGAAFDSIAALAYARWERLRGKAEFPAAAHDDVSDGRFLTPNSIRIAWDNPVSNPRIVFLGDDLATQLAGIAGDAWPNVPVESPLVELLRRISRCAIDGRRAAEFDERITDSQGWIRDCQGLALPFTGNESGAWIVDIVFDLDDPIVGEPVLQLDADEDVLLLEQELDPDEMPSLEKASPPPPPVLFVCVSDTARRTLDRTRPAKGAGGSLAAARARWGRAGRNPSSSAISATGQDWTEPLLLIRPWETASGETGCPPPADATSTADQLLRSLQLARTQAEAASGSEERSHLALYRAIGAAHDFALLAAQAPARFVEMAIEAGLKVQARAPMTPVVKLIFGAGYDRSRLAEYASALTHAFRHGVPAGTFADYLLDFDGGLKGVVRAERTLRRASERPPTGPARLEAKLRNVPVQALDSLDPAGQEFALVLARRLPDGSVALLGEVPPDDRLFRAAARRLLQR